MAKNLNLSCHPHFQSHLADDKIVHYVSEPWCRIMSNVHQLLIREGPKNGCGILSVVHSQSRQMIHHHISEPFLSRISMLNS